jgi:hypothetical protein
MRAQGESVELATARVAERVVAEVVVEVRVDVAALGQSVRVNNGY